MKTYSIDAFGNPLPTQTTAGGQGQINVTATMFLYSDGEYDPALMGYYLRVGCHRPEIGRFIGLDNHEGETQDPAVLQRFGYGGHAPIRAADPACPGA